jgi:heme-degrading monooxygenase HmoA
MKVRAWRFWTAPADGEAWFHYCDETVLQELTSVAGNRGVFVLWRGGREETEFVLFSLWDDEDSPATDAALTRALAHLEHDEYSLRREVDAIEYECVSRGAIALTAALSFEP